MSRVALFIYPLLLLIVLVQPHVIRGHAFYGFDAAFVQSFVTMIAAGLAGLTYVLQRRETLRREQEKVALQGELLESFRYVATVNHRLPLLQSMTTQLLSDRRQTRQGHREPLRSLLAIAVVSVAKTNWGHLRVVEAATGRTIAEFTHRQRDEELLPSALIGNKSLLDSATGGGRLAEESNFSLLGSSDRAASVRSFLILPCSRFTPEDQAALQSVLDQAQLFFHYLSAERIVV